ncbi:MAG: cell division protein ZapE [Sutterellaceae bacterium]|nr:cell division protein ZapE [Burkholderiaceae bacterium]MCX7901883.1 cell division protein ZapE [Burkholderiaceae bacterium]MDW8430411.1 cell division protein ZapE [Sutterellaceae bacterium]
MSFRAHLDELLAARGYRLDAAQQVAAARLQQLDADWRAYKAQRSNAVARLLRRPPIPRGVYLWGGVGRGKSFLMDAFFAAVPLVRKTRVHFHEFMRGVHRELDDVKGTPDPLDEVARRIARRYRLICFDEFHVSDIADAMILYRLLARLFALGVGFVMTSNYRPDDLYADGLHRDRILPAIALLKERLDVLHVDGGTDYRSLALERIDTYLMPLGPEAEARLAAAFRSLAETEDEEPLLNIEMRQIPARRRAGGVIWFDFPVLCGGPRSQNDYLEIAARFHTVLLSNVPVMSAAQAAEARRFTWLVDILYDRRVKLIVSAQAAPGSLYTAGALAVEFQRTASRLMEMQSRAYLEAPRRDIVGVP